MEASPNNAGSSNGRTADFESVNESSNLSRAVCSRCRETKLVSEFPKNKSRANGRSGWCDLCNKSYQREWHQRNKNKRNIRIREQSLKRKQLAQVFLMEFFSQNFCVDCGESNPIVLDFDHVSDDKDKDISIMLRNCNSLDKLKKEIAKCEVVCSNCHRIRTATRGNYWRHSFLS